MNQQTFSAWLLLVGLAYLTTISSVPAEETQPAKPAATVANAEKSTQSQVDIDNFTFSPPVLTVSAGTTVVWINKDDVPHTVVSNDKKFKSGTLDTDGKFSFKFTEPGTYPYFCGIHAHMTGQIIVK